MSKNLYECSDDEMVDYMFQAVTGKGPQIGAQVQIPQEISNQSDKHLKKRMGQYIAMLRAMQLWYHAAHHVTRGVGFPGDHATIYSNFYNEIEQEFDSAVEKVIGLTNDEDMADPEKVTHMSLILMRNYPSPSKCTSLSIASTALEMEKHYLEAVDSIFDDLEESGSMTLGLDDFLMSSYNKHEGHLYALQQRVKTELED